MKISNLRTAHASSNNNTDYLGEERRQTGRRDGDIRYDMNAIDQGLEQLAYARDKLRSASTASQVAHALSLETEAINAMMAVRTSKARQSA